MNYLAEIKKQKPLIHNITNIVVANFSANGLLALGASPAMANAPEEAAEMAAHADALVLNIGTCTQDQLEAMILAGKAANQKNVPVILDPVAIGATAFRASVVQQILDKIDVAVIRGNTGEIAVLGEMAVEIKGADSLVGEISPHVAINVAKKYGAIVIATGETDTITDGESFTQCKNSVPMLSSITGAGCLLTAVVGAFVSVGTDFYNASVKAVCSYGVAAELAYGTASSPGSFLAAFLDEIYALTDEKVKSKAIIRELTLKGE
ncbi:hydroxyethylthiazole kinase [Virgibacillus phasianinus]|uniref:Hydroxyethylthiazole kinase n=1 Tax=Virgibacillus phasianinus TaxID=2017483 RepID=A0A220U0K8_9BACI|nr:hydroxyethylthiazole kinase [Virgibacillus phasianinus]ASK61522.1 hydroxyethylthiazole kinase [Virgibacillus phasianinus]